MGGGVRHHSSRPRIYLVTYVYICSMYLCKSSAALYLERASLCLCLSHVVTTLWNTLCPHYTRLQYSLWRHITLLFSHKIVQESVRKILIHQDNFLLKCVCVIRSISSWDDRRKEDLRLDPHFRWEAPRKNWAFLRNFLPAAVWPVVFHGSS